MLVHQKTVVRDGTIFIPEDNLSVKSRGHSTYKIPLMYTKNGLCIVSDSPPRNKGDDLGYANIREMNKHNSVRTLGSGNFLAETRAQRFNVSFTRGNADYVGHSSHTQLAL